MARDVTTVIESCFSAGSGVAAESVAFTMKVDVPAAVGVPEIIPELLKLRPAGSEEPDASDQVTGGAPPELFNVAL
jgi:hypothetical protein